MRLDTGSAKHLILVRRSSKRLKSLANGHQVGSDEMLSSARGVSEFKDSSSRPGITAFAIISGKSVRTSYVLAVNALANSCKHTSFHFSIICNRQVAMIKFMHTPVGPLELVAAFLKLEFTGT